VPGHTRIAPTTGDTTETESHHEAEEAEEESLPAGNILGVIYVLIGQYDDVACIKHVAMYNATHFYTVFCR